MISQGRNTSTDSRSGKKVKAFMTTQTPNTRPNCALKGRCQQTPHNSAMPVKAAGYQCSSRLGDPRQSSSTTSPRIPTSLGNSLSDTDFGHHWCSHDRRSFIFTPQDPIASRYTLPARSLLELTDDSQSKDTASALILFIVGRKDRAIGIGRPTGVSFLDLVFDGF